MYTEYFGFREKPFNVTPDSRFFYANSAYQEAYANLLYGIRERKGFVVLTGEVGTGKTTLLRRLMVNLEANVRFVFFYNTTLTFEELLRFTCTELGLTVKEQSRLEQIQALNTFLLGQLANGGTAALLIDEAQNLQDDVLENLRLLSNLEATGEKLLQIILVGQPELEAKLDQPALRQLKQRITLHCYLDRLKDPEVGDFISYRLRTAGYEGKDLFTPEAIQRVAAYSRGIPRLINIICDNALLIAYATTQKTIAAATINEVARDLRLTTTLQPIVSPIPQEQVATPYVPAVWEDTKERAPSFSPPKRRRVAWIGALTALFLIGGGAVVLSPLSGKDTPADLGSTVKGLLNSVEKRLGIPEKVTSPPPPTSTEVNGKQDQGPELDAEKSNVPLPQQNSASSSLLADLDPQKNTRPLDFSPEVELKKEAASTGEGSIQFSDILPISFSADARKERLFVIRYGSTISSIAADAYGSNLFLGIDLLKEFNPHLENINWILAGQKLWLPPLTAETLLRKEEDGSYRFIVSSFRSQQKAQRLAREARAKGYDVSVTPRKISNDALLYRVEIENLKTPETINKAWTEASANRWLVLEEKKEPKKQAGR
jgi:general secretion pathway protein A